MSNQFLGAATYYVAIDGYSSSPVNFGPYTLNVFCGKNNTDGYFSPLVSSISCDGVQKSATTERVAGHGKQFYRFDVFSTDYFQFSMCNSNVSERWLSKLTLYNSAGTQLASATINCPQGLFI